MTIASNLLSLGMPAALAGAIGATPGTALTTAVTTKATAAQLTSNVCFFTTVASSGATLLPPADMSPPVAIYNGGGQNLSVFANGTNTINALSAGAAFTVTNGKGAIFYPAQTGWVAILGA
jgi:hypothetical protein